MSSPRPSPFPFPAIPPPSTVTDDVPCRQCSYNLRTLPTDGFCPECGSLVAKSIYGNLLKFSDPAWVRKLGRGIRFIQWGIPPIIMGATFRGVNTMRNFGVRIPFDLPLAPLLSLAGVFLFVFGFWLITEPDPAASEKMNTEPSAKSPA
jgi:hypothetical protein